MSRLSARRSWPVMTTGFMALVAVTVTVATRNALLLEHANLAEEVVGPEGVLRFAADVDFGGALTKDEELVGQVPFDRRAVAAGHVDFIRVLGNPGPLSLVEARKERQLLDVLDVQGPSLT
jgi:hypothetical protein